MIFDSLLGLEITRILLLVVFPVVITQFTKWTTHFLSGSKKDVTKYTNCYLQTFCQRVNKILFGEYRYLMIIEVTCSKALRIKVRNQVQAIIFISYTYKILCAVVLVCKDFEDSSLHCRSHGQSEIYIYLHLRFMIHCYCNTL